MNLLERIVFWFVAAGVVVLAGVYFFSHAMSPELPKSWDYKDVVSILLAIVTVALTILGIVIAIAAFWSYQKITDLAADRAESASKLFLGSPTFTDRVDAIISERMENLRKDQLEKTLNLSASPMPEGGGDFPDAPWVDQ